MISSVSIAELKMLSQMPGGADMLREMNRMKMEPSYDASTDKQRHRHNRQRIWRSAFTYFRKGCKYQNGEARRLARQFTDAYFSAARQRG